MHRFTSLPDKTTVKQAADFLLLSHGKATPSAVRQRLTEQNLWLELTTVFALLEIIAEEQNWQCHAKTGQELYYTQANENPNFYALQKIGFGYDFSLN